MGEGDFIEIHNKTSDAFGQFFLAWLTFLSYCDTGLHYMAIPSYQVKDLTALDIQHTLRHSRIYILGIAPKIAEAGEGKLTFVGKSPRQVIATHLAVALILAVSLQNQGEQETNLREAIHRLCDEAASLKQPQMISACANEVQCALDQNPWKIKVPEILERLDKLRHIYFPGSPALDLGPSRSPRNASIPDVAIDSASPAQPINGQFPIPSS